MFTSVNIEYFNKDALNSKFYSNLSVAIDIENSSCYYYYLLLTLAQTPQSTVILYSYSTLVHVLVCIADLSTFKYILPTLWNKLDTSSLWWLAATAKAVLETELMLLDERRLKDLLSLPESSDFLKNLFPSEQTRQSTSLAIPLLNSQHIDLIREGLKLSGFSNFINKREQSLLEINWQEEDAVFKQRRTSTLSTLLFLQRLSNRSSPDYLNAITTYYLRTNMEESKTTEAPKPQSIAVSHKGEIAYKLEKFSTVNPSASVVHANKKKWWTYFVPFLARKQDETLTGETNIKAQDSFDTSAASIIPRSPSETYKSLIGGPILLFDSLSICLQLMLPHLHNETSFSFSALHSSETQSVRKFTSPLLKNLMRATVAHIVVKTILGVLYANPSWIVEIKAAIQTGSCESRLSPHSQTLLNVICKTALQLVNSCTDASRQADSRKDSHHQAKASEGQKMNETLELGHPFNSMKINDSPSTELALKNNANASENQNSAHGSSSVAATPSDFELPFVKQDFILNSKKNSPLVFNEGVY